MSRGAAPSDLRARHVLEQYRARDDLASKDLPHWAQDRVTVTTPSAQPVDRGEKSWQVLWVPAIFPKNGHSYHSSDVCSRLCLCRSWDSRPAAPRLHATCSGPAYWVALPSRCPRSQRWPGTMRRPHRQHVTSPRATRGAHAARNCWCSYPYRGSGMTPTRRDQTLADPCLAAGMGGWGSRVVPERHVPDGSQGEHDEGRGCSLPASAHF